MLYRAFPEVGEGALTVMRAALVRESSLAQWAERFRLGEHLVLGRGEDQRGGRGRPGILASAFEAVIGAFYLDQGWVAVQAFLGPLVREASASLSPSQRAQDAKSQLQYQAQAAFGSLPTYRVVSVEGPEHRPLFTVEVSIGDRSTSHGVGPSKQAAEQDAASRLLEAWPELPAPKESDPCS